ncbi:MAG: rRNA maturation RNase YbeY [Candidatus Symbiothrix sp.]|jgi:rRNA maturation RNase YbeY|nr:rRNA maturation RNase YbeY [Candidatus Symbiothrix sp.]
MSFFYEADTVSFPKIKRRKTSAWIKSVIASHDKRTGNITYIFCSDAEILRINRQYLQHDYYTDIITFDYTEGEIVSGDLFISLDTVRTNSEKFKTNYDEELHRVMIHGVLHLCGFKDKTPEEEQLMREMENKALADLSK